MRLCDLVSPLKNGAPLRDGDRSALAVAGTREIRSGEPVAFVKIVAVAPSTPVTVTFAWPPAGVATRYALAGIST